MPIVVGETIGAYRIVEQLGQGGMATVFKAYHASLDRYVAIKALHPAFKEDSNFQARFQREARVVAKLDHANIVPIYDFSEYEGRPYLVMKFIEGETLKARLLRQALTIEGIRKIADAVGVALSYAHSQGILHRDIKPSNVLLSKDGQIYLADFGLARIAAAGESTMSSDMMLGTPQYISPEQAMGKRDLDEGTDIYSFGVLLYELMVGQVPFSADTPYAIIHDHIYSPLPLPRSINPLLPEAVERVLLKALAKDRADRYPSVAGLVEAFQEAVQGLENYPIAGQPDYAGITKIASTDTDHQVILSPEPSLIEAADLSDEKSKTNVSSPFVDQTPSAPKKLDKKPLLQRWYIWLLIAAVIFWVCAGAWLGVGVLRKGRMKKIQPTLVNTPVQQPVDVPMDAVQNARRRVQENLGDPVAHLDLAVILIDARQYEDVMMELDMVTTLAQEIGFYIDNGRRLVEQQKWIAAAWVFLRYMELKTEPPVGDLFDLWHESVYKAFNDPDAMRVIDIDRIRAVDPAISGVARAQADLAAGNPAQAEIDIMQTLKQNENFKEALLVQAHVFAVRNLPDRARNILNTITKTESPPWIQDEITRLRETQNLIPR